MPSFATLASTALFVVDSGCYGTPTVCYRGYCTKNLFQFRLICTKIRDFLVHRELLVLGKLFQRNDTDYTNEELIIFLTPRIVRRPSDLNKHNMGQKYEKTGYKKERLAYDFPLFAHH